MLTPISDEVCMFTSVGSFAKMGAHPVEDGVEFTAALPAGKQWNLRLLDVSSFKVKYQIQLTEEFKIGQLYSIVVKLEGGETFEGLSYDYISEEERIVDPYASVICGRDQWGDLAADGKRAAREFAVYAGVPQGDYTWVNSTPKIAPNDMILYKLHMRGFTMANGLPASKKGNDLGLVAKLSYLKELGVNVIELQPIYDFEDVYLNTVRSIDEKGKVSETIEPIGKVNYWGYGNAFYLAPKASYFGGAAKAVNRCKAMIDAIHGAGMQVIMELSISAEKGASYICDVLWHWVKEYRVDGFHLLGANLPMDAILAHPGLAETKIFADNFPQWALNDEDATKHLFFYEGSFTHVARQMQNHMQGSMVQFTNYLRRQNSHYGFVNYAANTTGFTLWDSFSYGEKHNEANGEDNRDGSNMGYTHNYGVEGESNSRKLRQLRLQQVRNALCNVMLSQAVPLLLAGDEVANSQQGNNNPYCQDNELGWALFGKTKGRDQLQAFVKSLINFRQKHPQIRGEEPVRMQDYKHLGMPDLSYHGKEPWLMSIGDELRCIGLLYGGGYTASDAEDVYIVYNYQYDPAEVALPKLGKGYRWQLVMNTGDESTFGFEPAALEDQKLFIAAGSTVSILVSAKEDN